MALVAVERLDGLDGGLDGFRRTNHYPAHLLRITNTINTLLGPVLA
jgi:hypothetical protein